MKKSIGIIGQFAPPMHGLAKALDTLYNSHLAEEFDFKKFNLTDNKKFLSNVFGILFSKLDLYYLTISQSKFGNIRDLILIKLIQLKKRKIIIHLHGGDFRSALEKDFGYIQRRMNYEILGKVDSAIVLGESLKHIFEGIIPKEKIQVVKNCVDSEFILSDEKFNDKIDLLKEKKEFKILYLSNFIENKGYKDVLNLAKLVKEQNNRRYKFIFAGEFFRKADEIEFLEFIEKNRLGELVQYEGVVQGKKKRKLLKESDIFILLTKYRNEGQPISIIEAIVNGNIIITTNHAGILSILDEERMCIFNKEKIDTLEILNEINKIYEKREKIITVLKENRTEIICDFSESEYLEKFEKIFK